MGKLTRALALKKPSDPRELTTSSRNTTLHCRKHSVRPRPVQRATLTPRHQPFGAQPSRRQCLKEPRTASVLQRQPENCPPGRAWHV